MAIARQDEVQKLLGELKKTQQQLNKLEERFEVRPKNRLTADIASEYKAAPAGTLPMVLTIIAVVGGSYFLLGDRITDTNNRIDDTNNLIRTVKSDLEKDIDGLKKDIDGLEKDIDGLEMDIADINSKLDRLLLK